MFASHVHGESDVLWVHIARTALVEDHLHRDSDGLAIGALRLREREVDRPDVITLDPVHLHARPREETIVLMVLEADLVARRALREFLEDDAGVEVRLRRRRRARGGGARARAGGRCGRRIARQSGDEEDRAGKGPAQQPGRRARAFAIRHVAGLYGVPVGTGVLAGAVGAVVAGAVDGGVTREELPGTARGEPGTALGAGRGASRRVGGTIVSTAGTASPSVPRAFSGIGAKFPDAVA